MLGFQEFNSLEILKKALQEVQMDWYEDESLLLSLCIKRLPEKIEGYNSTFYIEAGVNVRFSKKILSTTLANSINLPDFLVVSTHHLPEGLIDSSIKFNRKIKVIKKPARTFYGISKQRKRPLVGGVSTMNCKYKGPGTLGALLKLKGSEHTYAISNWHVFANSNGRLGDKILQPSRYDGGKFKTHQIGELVWYRLDSFMDAALVKIDNNVKIGIGIKGQLNLKEILEPKMHLPIEKYGRTTQKTEGTISGFYESIKVNHPEYPLGEMVFKDQIVCDLKADLGDSGSLLTTSKGEVIGLIFASDLKGCCLANRLNLSRPLTSGAITNKNHNIFQSLEIDNFK